MYIPIPIGKTGGVLPHNYTHTHTHTHTYVLQSPWLEPVVTHLPTIDQAKKTVRQSAYKKMRESGMANYAKKEKHLKNDGLILY